MALVPAPWRARILESLARNQSLAYSRYVQLATIKTDGRPACRTVVYRGFLNETNDLTFITNIYSDKIAEIAANPSAEVCWYFPKSREQYRLSGALQVVQHDTDDEKLLKARKHAWHQISDGARAQFDWPHPGEPRVAPPEAFDPPAPPKDDVLPAFCLLIMTVYKVDLLELLPNKRTVFDLQGDKENGQAAWVSTDVNP